MRVLRLDIESAPALAYIWDLRTRYVPVKQVAEPGYMLCFAAQWEGEDDVMFYSLWEHGIKRMVQAAYDLLDEADAVLHYNGQKYDIPVMNREFIRQGYVPPTTFKQIDLYRTVTKQFKFMSNSMNHVCEQLGLPVKVEHKGMELWTGVMAGNKEDQSIMKEYNIQDVAMLGFLYEYLQPWITDHPNRGMWVEDSETPVCPNCGGTHFQKRGVERPANVNAYQRLKCMDCGANCRGRVAIHPSEGLDDTKNPEDLDRTARVDPKTSTAPRGLTMGAR